MRPDRSEGLYFRFWSEASPHFLVCGAPTDPLPHRVCPGKVFADTNVWMAVACIIAAFQVPVSRNERGENVPPSAQFTSGFVRCVARNIVRRPVCWLME